MSKEAIYKMAKAKYGDYKAAGIDLNAKQQKKFNQIRRTQGGGAARDYRRKQLAQAANKQGVNVTPGSKNAGSAVSEPFFGQNPDFQTAEGLATAQANQNQYNIEQQVQYNRPNEQTAFGSLQYGPNGERIQTLSENQAAINQQRENIDLGLGGAVNAQMGQLSQPFQFNSQYDPRAQAGFDARQKIQQEQYASDAKRINDEYGQRENALRQNLADRGIAEGSELYNKELERFGTERDNALQSAQDSARSFAGQEQANQFGMALQGQGQDFGMQSQSYQMPFQTTGALLNMQRGVINPQFQPMMGINTQPVDVAGIGLGFGGFQNAQELQRMQNQQQKWNINNTPRGGGGGGGLGYDPYKLSAQEFQQQMQLMGMQNQWANQGQPSTTEKIVGGLLPGVGMGLGAGIGGKFF